MQSERFYETFSSAARPIVSMLDMPIGGDMWMTLEWQFIFSNICVHANVPNPPQHAVHWSAVHTQGASLPREVPYPIPYRLDGQKCPLNSLFKLWNQRILRLLIEPNFEFWHLRPTQFFVIVLLLNWKFWATVLKQLGRDTSFSFYQKCSLCPSYLCTVRLST